jgi:hypothetical protein
MLTITAYSNEFLDAKADYIAKPSFSEVYPEPAQSTAMVSLLKRRFARNETKVPLNRLVCLNRFQMSLRN